MASLLAILWEYGYFAKSNKNDHYGHFSTSRVACVIFILKK